MLVSTMSIPEIQTLQKKSFLQETQRPPSTARLLFHKGTSDFSVDRVRVQEMDVEKLAEQKVEGQPSAKRGMGQGYSKEIIRKTISVEREVTGEAYLALEAHKLAGMVKRTTADVLDKIELDMRNFIGMGTGSSFTDNAGFTIDTTTGDGLSLFNTAHTLKLSSVTCSNLLSGGPSIADDSLEEAEDHFAYNIRDNYGMPIKMVPTHIIHTRKASVMNRVARLLGSQSPETVQGDENVNSGLLNVYRGKYKSLVVDFDVDVFDLPDTTKSYWWMLACLGGPVEESFQGHYISWLSPSQAPMEVDQSKWILSWVSRACYGIGAASWKGILLSAATN